MDVGGKPRLLRHAGSLGVGSFIAVTHEEADERLRSGWHVEPPLLELIEGDNDSP